MNRFWRLLLAVAISLSVFVPLASAGPAPKIDVCHYDADGGTYHKINISGNAYDQRLAHGDATPGDLFPGMEGYEFDGECSPVTLDSDNDGIPDAVDNCPTVANADQLDQYGSAFGDACEDTVGDGTLDVDEPNLCVHISGAVILENGSAYCSTTDGGIATPNIAIANGDDARATAGEDPGDSGNEATAVGYIAVARAGNGSRNSAVAKGDDTFVFARLGNDNTAEARGYDGYAAAGAGDSNLARTIGDYAESLAWGGDGNVATATGDGVSKLGGPSALTFKGSGNTVTAIGAGASAVATFMILGDNNTAIADGDGAAAVTAPGNNNTARATGVDAVARAHYGDWNTATATGDKADAAAHNGNGNTAIADGDDSFACAGGGDDGETATNTDLCTN
jgi:hypothetical protein